MKVAAALTLAALSACRSAPPLRPPTWEKPGATEQMWRRDRGFCDAQASGSPVGPTQQLLVFNGCLEGKGWVRR